MLSPEQSSILFEKIDTLLNELKSTLGENPPSWESFLELKKIISEIKKRVNLAETQSLVIAEELKKLYKAGKVKENIIEELSENIKSSVSKDISSGRERVDLMFEEARLFSSLFSMRDPTLGSKGERIAPFIKKITKKLALNEAEAFNLETASYLYDAGMFTLEDSILKKRGRYTDIERKIMEKHVETGAALTSESESLKGLSFIIRHHHERFDGGGYPSGLKGDKMPLASRVLSVCDAFDAMTTVRKYKEPMEVDDAVRELNRCAGTQFDPNIVKVFVKVL